VGISLVDQQAGDLRRTEAGGVHALHEKPSVLTLAERHEGDAVVLSAEGIVDMAAAPTLTEQIRAILRQRPAALVVDLTGVTFLATAGMSVLMEAYRKSKELAICFRVVAQGPVTVKSMQLLGIDDLLAIYPTVSTALQGVPSSGTSTA
jgi:anti-sigma B factor antagonist